jgi:hypothetical protein
MKIEQPKRWLKRVVLGLLGLAALTASVLAILATFTKFPGEEKTPAGVRRDTALYITMRDGVQIAVDVWLPQDYQAGQRLPVLLRTTRYGRDGQFGWAYRLAVAFKQTDPHDEQTDYLNQRHFVVIVGDARAAVPAVVIANRSFHAKRFPIWANLSTGRPSSRGPTAVLELLEGRTRERRRS